jgi:hypothetical protein
MPVLDELDEALAFAATLAQPVVAACAAAAS